jgi:hypothetical protein
MREAVEKFVNHWLMEINLKIDSAVDRNYAIEYFEKEQKKWDSIYNSRPEPNKESAAVNYLYHNYLMGEDVAEILKKENFYAHYFYGNDLFFCPLNLPETKDHDNTEDIIDDKNDENDNQIEIRYEPTPEFRFRLTDELYDDLYKQTFDFICIKELLRRFKDDTIQNKLSNLPISNTLISKLGQSSDINNEFNGVPLDLVRKFFNQLCHKDIDVLTPIQLNNFISRAFQGDSSIEKQTLNTSHISKTMIIKLFHLFYKASIQDFSYENSKCGIEKYQKLLTDNFNNWEHAKISNNFSRNVTNSIWHDKL